MGVLAGEAECKGLATDLGFADSAGLGVFPFMVVARVNRVMSQTTVGQVAGNGGDRPNHQPVLYFLGQRPMRRLLTMAIALGGFSAVMPCEAIAFNFASGSGGTATLGPAHLTPSPNQPEKGAQSGIAGKSAIGAAPDTLSPQLPAGMQLAQRIIALMRNRAPESVASSHLPFANPASLPGQLPTANAESDFFNTFANAFAMEQLQGSEVWVGVQVITFVHDALEEIDMMRTPFDFAHDAYDQLPTGSLSGSSDPHAQSANGPQNADRLRTDLRQRSTRITNYAPKAPDAFTATQHDSEAREHVLEARDATLGRQLQQQAGQENTVPVGDPTAPATFDPQHNQLGYTSDYKDVITQDGSGSVLVSTGGWLLVLGLIQFGVRRLLQGMAKKQS